MVTIVKNAQRQMPGWTLFSTELPDPTKEFDVMHIDQSISYNVSLTPAELLKFKESGTPRQWRYTKVDKPVIKLPKESVFAVYIVDKNTRERIPLDITCENVVVTNDEVLLETSKIVERRIFRVNFSNYNAAPNKDTWTDCFIGINDTDVAEKIKAKYDNGNGYTSYNIVDSYRFNY